MDRSIKHVHSKIVCKLCGATITQCRCIDDAKHIEYQTCEDCQRKQSGLTDYRKWFKDAAR